MGMADIIKHVKQIMNNKGDLSDDFIRQVNRSVIKKLND